MPWDMLHRASRDWDDIDEANAKDLAEEMSWPAPEPLGMGHKWKLEGPSLVCQNCGRHSLGLVWDRLAGRCQGKA
jgi:hypothetical protein